MWSTGRSGCCRGHRGSRFEPPTERRYADSMNGFPAAPDVMEGRPWRRGPVPARRPSETRDVPRGRILCLVVWESSTRFEEGTDDGPTRFLPLVLAGLGAAGCRSAVRGRRSDPAAGHVRAHPGRSAERLAPKGTPAQMIDVRSRQEYLTRHIKGAISIPSTPSRSASPRSPARAWSSSIARARTTSPVWPTESLPAWDTGT